MQSRNEYLETLIRGQGYLTKSKKEKSALLNEYCKNTKQNRKYVIRKIRKGKWVKDPTKIKKRKRKEYYDGDVRVNLIKIWKIFDLPCGQRLRDNLQNAWIANGVTTGYRYPVKITIPTDKQNCYFFSLHQHSLLYNL